MNCPHLLKRYLDILLSVLGTPLVDNLLVAAQDNLRAAAHSPEGADQGSLLVVAPGLGSRLVAAHTHWAVHIHQVDRSLGCKPWITAISRFSLEGGYGCGLWRCYDPLPKMPIRIRSLWEKSGPNLLFLP